MTATQMQTRSGVASQLINGILAIAPLANLAKYQARNMMIKRAENLGIPWRETVKNLSSRNWEDEFKTIQNSQLTYPEYYQRSFHGYEKGHLCWDAAFEFEVAANAVHASLWADAGAKGDNKLRQTYHNVLKAQIPTQPQKILDLHCTVGVSTFALQAVYPQAKITGLDFSPYYLTVAQYNSQQRNSKIDWIHALPEATGLPEASFDLVSAFLLFHEMPQQATRKIFAEARRLLSPGGYFTFMDMNPQSEVYKKMPPYILTLLKSTEPYLDQYFSLDIEQALIEAGFQAPTITPNSPRHRTVIAQAI
jgi:ubiquinone/menaquinone biosynthesis C-methylase UbiE